MARIGVLIALRVTENAVRNLRRVSNTIDQVAESGERSEASLKRFDLALAAVGATAALALGAAAARAADLEDVMARLETVTRSTSQTLGTSLGRAEDNARKFSTQFAISAREVIDAQFQLATAGIKVEEQLAGVRQAFKLSEATVGDFVEATKLLGQFLNTFGTSVRLGFLEPLAKTTRITDILSATVQRFQVTLPVLAQGFKFIIGPAKQLNLSLEETSVALGILNTAGFRGTLAGTALSNMFNKLNRAVERLNLDPSQFQDLGGNLESLAAFMQAVNEALSELTPIQAQIKLIEVFDIRAGRVVKTLADQFEQLQRVSNEFTIARGATERMARTIQSTTSRQFKRLINVLDNIATSIGKVINDALRPFITGIVDAARGVADFIESNRKLITPFAVVTAGVLAASAAFITWQIGIVAVTRSFQLLTGAAVAAGASQAASAIATTAAATNAAATTAALGRLTTAFTVVTVAARAFSGIFIAGALIAGIQILTGGIRGLFGSTNQFNDKLGETNQLIARTQTEFAGAATNARRLAAELEFIGKARRLGTKDPGILRGDEFGESAIAGEIAKQFAKGLDFNESIDIALEKIEDRDIVLDFTERLLRGANPSSINEATDVIQNAVDRMFRVDPSTKDLERLEVQGKVFQTVGAGMSGALRTLVGDLDENEQAAQKLINNFVLLGEITSQLTTESDSLSAALAMSGTDAERRNEAIRDSFNALTAQTRQLKSVTDQFIENALASEKTLRGVQDLQGAFETLAKERLCLGLAADDDLPTFIGNVQAAAKNLAKTGEVTTELERGVQQLIDGFGELERKTQLVGVPAADLLSVYEELTKIYNRNKSAVDRLKISNDQLGQGLISTEKNVRIRAESEFAVAANIFNTARLVEDLIEAEDRLNQARRDTPGASAAAVAAFLDAKAAAEDRFAQETFEIKVKLREDVLKSQLLGAFKDITGFGLSERIGQDIRKGGSAIQSVLNDLITGGFDATALTGELNNAFRKFIAGNTLQFAADKVATTFFKAAGIGLDEFNKIIATVIAQSEDVLAGLTPAEQLQFVGQLVNTLSEQIFGLNLALEETKDKFNAIRDSVISIEVALVTAQGAERALLSELQQIIATPGNAIADLESKRRIVERIISEAKKLDAPTAQRAGERELTRLLEIILGASDKIQDSVGQLPAATLEKLDVVKRNVISVTNELDKVLSNIGAKIGAAIGGPGGLALGSALGTILGGDDPALTARLIGTSKQFADNIRGALSDLADTLGLSGIGSAPEEIKKQADAAAAVIDSANSILRASEVAATTIASAITQPFADFAESTKALERVVNSGAIATVTKQLDFDIDVEGNTFEVNTNVTGGGGVADSSVLDDVEVRAIVDKVKEAIELANVDALRDMEERLTALRR